MSIKIRVCRFTVDGVLRSGWMIMSRNGMLLSAEGCSMVYSRSGAIELR